MATIFADVTHKLLAKAVPSGGVHRTSAPVLRSSREEGTFEEAFWQRPQKGETDLILKAARAYQRHRRKIVSAARKQSLENTGSAALPRPFLIEDCIAAMRPSPDTLVNLALRPLSNSALQLLEWLCEMARLCKGRLYPSYDGMMDAVAFCRQTIANSIRQLETIGILEKQRRCKRIEDSPQRFEQTSNVYRLRLPKALYRFLPAYLRPQPVPDCEQWRQREELAALAFMQRAARMTPVIEILPEDEQSMLTQVEDDGLRATLASLFSSFDESESTKQTQTLKDSIYNRVQKDQPTAEPPNF